MTSRTENARRARHRRLIIIGLAVVMIAFVGIEIALQGAAPSALPLSDTVLLHAVTVLNIILLLVLLFVLGRNLIKLYVDRRHGKLGSKFQTKLMVTYVGLSLVPTIILFLVASDFIQKSVDRWFSKDVAAVHERARDLARRARVVQELQLIDTAQALSRQVTDGRYFQDEAWQALARDMGNILAEQRHLDLDSLAIHRGNLQLLEPRLRDDTFLKGREFLLDVPPQSILLGMSGQTFRHSSEIEGRNILIQAGVPVFTPRGSEVAAVLVVSRVIDGALAAEADAIEQLYRDYTQGVEEKEPITNAYLLTFLLISLLIIFAAVWMGLYLARGVTVPIRKLSEGTRAVAAGNLDYRVAVESNDELGVLVQSFNRMTEDLSASQSSLELSRSELERSISELEERRSYMESVLANIATGVVSIDADGRITTFNRAAEGMLEIDASEAVGVAYRQVFAGAELAELRALMQHARPRHAVEQELVVSAAGQRLTLAVHCSALRDKAGEYLGTVVVLDDLTGMIRAQKAAAWREVARRIAHEIRNPLTPIQLSAQRIARRYRRVAGGEEEYAVVEEGTRTILQEVAALKSLVEEFSRFARMPSANPVSADVHRILEDSLRPYPEIYPELEIVRRFADHTPPLQLDPDQMRRAFTNLFDNAVKAMQGRGRLWVSTAYDPELEVVRVEVADNGPGIRAEDKDRLFVPYFSRERDGTGLGLAIVRQIISDHRGYIRVVDNVPRGATFVIELPAGQQPGGESGS